MRRTEVFEKGRPIVLAHRGGGAEAPENTIEAARHMLSLGVRFLETDVRNTRDGVPVLCHDPTLERRFGDPRTVDEIDWAELCEKRDVDGCRPVTVGDMLTQVPGAVVNIDCKTDQVVMPTLAAVRDAGAIDRVCLTSFSSRRVARLARVTGERATIGMGALEVVRLVLAARLPRWVGSSLRVVPRGRGARAVQVPVASGGIEVVTPRFLDAAHDAGHVVHVWTIDEAAEMHRLLDLGVDGIVTDRPSVAVEVFRERGLPLL